MLAQLTPGLDNLTFVGDRLFVSNFTGEITEILAGGDTRTVLPGGLNWPLDLAMGDDGNLYVADGTYFYVLRADGSLETVGMLFSPGIPRLPSRSGRGGCRRVRRDNVRWPGRPLPARRQRNRLPRRRIRPALRCGDRTRRHGRVRRTRHRSRALAAIGQRRNTRVRPARSGRRRLRPRRQALGRRVGCGPGGPAGRVADRNRGRRPCSGHRASLVRRRPALHRRRRRQGSLAVDLDSNERRTIASGLPVGPPPGVEPKPLKGMPPFSGPQGPFAGIAAGPDGTLYVSADGDGSVLALRRVDT